MRTIPFQPLRRQLTRASLLVALGSWGFLSPVAVAEEPTTPTNVDTPPLVEAKLTSSNTELAEPLEAAEPTQAPAIPLAPALVPTPAPAPDLLPVMELLAGRLTSIEESLARQQWLAFEERQSTLRQLTYVFVFFGLALFLGVLLAALILARALHQFSEVVAATLPAARALPPAPPVAALGPGETSLAPLAAPVDPISTRFLGAVEQLEKRIAELEQTTRKSIADHSADGSGGNGASPAAASPVTPLRSPESAFSVSELQKKQYPVTPAVPAGPPAAPTREQRIAEEIALLLGKGQSLLNLGQADAALACFDDALERKPDHAEAHVKRGLALEKLQKLDGALESYDRAIAADRTMTLAYLYKGAVCNRLQRFQEALDCYEKALHTEQEQAA